MGSAFNPIVGFQVFSLVNSGLNLGTSIVTGQGIGQAFGTFAASLAISGGFAYLGVHDLVNPIMRMGGFAIEGGAIGAAGAAINKGDIGQSAMLGGVTGATMGFLSSEQFQNWRQGAGFLSNKEVANHNRKVAELMNMISGDGKSYDVSVITHGQHAALMGRESDIGGRSLFTIGKYGNDNKAGGWLRNLAYIEGKTVPGILINESGSGWHIASTYHGLTNSQLALFEAYVSGGPNTFALTTNCAEWVAGGLKSMGIYVPAHEYRTLGVADPSKFGKDDR